MPAFPRGERIPIVGTRGPTMGIWELSPGSSILRDNPFCRSETALFVVFGIGFARPNHP
jgi:hypothetical protein